MKKIIGYTTGVFDLFHIGHLNILRVAKSMCDELIVGVASNELVIKLKGKSPAIPLSERIEIVGSIKYVDKVLVQDKIDEIADFHKYHFDKIFKGSDWKGSEKWNKLEIDFKKLGIEVIFFPYTKTTSSTIIQKFLNEH